jgi:hypothetical protein
MDRRGHKGYRVRRDHKDRRVLREILVHKVLRERQATLRLYDPELCVSMTDHYTASFSPSDIMAELKLSF